MTTPDADRMKLIESGIRAGLKADRTDWKFSRIELVEGAPCPGAWQLSHGLRRLYVLDSEIPDYVPPEHVEAHTATLVERMMLGFWTGFGHGLERGRTQAAGKAVAS